ncbi:MAG: ATP-binding protein [Phycisphaera sp.]|nr:ATP-binding protein [Phycisphaera sp.]
MAASYDQRLVLDSRLDEVSRAEKVVLEAVVACNFSDTDQFAIKLALEEALANAIKHGNESDEGKHVTLEFHVDERKLTITICDEGTGFDPQRVPDPTLDENIEKPYGRGVWLIKTYMNEVSYNDQGNCLTMVKFRTHATSSSGR